jgi:hypothetical protein
VNKIINLRPVVPGVNFREKAAGRRPVPEGASFGNPMKSIKVFIILLVSPIDFGALD